MDTLQAPHYSYTFQNINTICDRSSTVSTKIKSDSIVYLSRIHILWMFGSAPTRASSRSPNKYSISHSKCLFSNLYSRLKIASSIAAMKLFCLLFRLRSGPNEAISFQQVEQDWRLVSSLSEMLRAWICKLLSICFDAYAKLSKF